MYNVVKHQSEFQNEKKKVEFCVVGGGMAGLCAALAAARGGVKTLLIQDRPVLGGNASSEIRMWICGAHGVDAKEGGILEELMLRNIYYNKELKYTLWDDILYGTCREEPLLEVIFNCSVNEVNREGRLLKSIRSWHLTRQCWIEIEADFFSDCSGDSILSHCGVEMRWGRESKSEFNESHAPIEADNKTMGNSVLIQLREVDEHRPFTAPPWAKKFNEEDLEHRGINPKGSNFWWLEFGGVMNTIDDADKIRDENMAIAYGAWDLIKNHPEGLAHNWELEWIGSLPGKRENLRYCGDIILTQNDIEAEGRFEDIVCHGGWSMDDHHPDAIYHKGKPTIFHPAPSPYGIPYRSLYSKDLDNLFCAGRNISATHMAMSSTRVMGTTAVMGQAVGSAVVIAMRRKLNTRGVYNEGIKDLQEHLQNHDQYLPWSSRKCVASSINGNSIGNTESIDILHNGIERNLNETDNGIWLETEQHIGWEFPGKQMIKTIRIISDSDFSRVKRMPCSFPKKENIAHMPAHMIKSADIEVLDQNKNWTHYTSISNNFHRLIQIKIDKAFYGFRINRIQSWSGEPVHLFSFDLESL